MTVTKEQIVENIKKLGYRASQYRSYDEYRKQQMEGSIKFKSDLEEAFGMKDHPLSDEIYAVACDYVCDDDDILSLYENIVNLIRKAG